MLTPRHHLVRISVLLVLFFLGCERPSSDVQTTNKELLREVYAAIDRQDFDRLRELISEDAVLHFSGVPEPLSRDATFDLMREFYAAFPDYTHAIQEMVAEGNRVAVRLTFDATHRGEFEGIAPTGKRVSYTGMHIGTIVNGVIEEWWVLEDNLGLMIQLGMQLTTGLVTGGPADVQAIEALYNEYSAAHSAGDLESFLSLFAEDAILMPPDEEIVEGKEAARAWARVFFDNYDMTETVSLSEVEFCQDWAFVRGTFVFEGIPKSEGEVFRFNGKFIQILSKKGDSSWVIRRAIYNRNNP